MAEKKDIELTPEKIKQEIKEAEEKFTKLKNRQQQLMAEIKLLGEEMARLQGEYRALTKLLGEKDEKEN